MIKTADVVNGKERINIKVMAIGSSGVGKSHFAATFPKCYFLLTEPGGEDTWLTNPELRNNVVGFDRFIPKDISDTKQVFENLEKACAEAKELALKGEIETVVLDNMTYLAENRFIYINQFEKEISTRTGEVNNQAMFGKLARWLYNFTLMKLTSLPCNVVLTVHEKLESDEAMEKKPDKNSPVVPSILGGFRDDAPGLVSLVLYLGKTSLGGGKYKYVARTNLGQGKNAKSRYPNIPEIIENISYNTIYSEIQKSLQQDKPK